MTNRVVTLSSLPTIHLANEFAIDQTTGSLYVSARASGAGSSIILQVFADTQTTRLIAGREQQGSADGFGSGAQFSGSTFIVLSSNGHIYVSDSYNHLIRQVVIATRAVTTFAGSGTSGDANGIGPIAQFSFPESIADDSNGNLYVADGGSNGPFIRCVRKIVINTREVSTLSGRGAGKMILMNTAIDAAFSRIYNLRFGGNGKLYFIDGAVFAKTIDKFTTDTSNKMFLFDKQYCCLKQFNLLSQTPTPSDLAGSCSDCTSSVDGVGATIRLKSDMPSQAIIPLAVDSVRGILYMYEHERQRIRVLQASSPCSAGSYCPSGSSVVDQGGPCTAGYYCPRGSDRIACPAGRYCLIGIAAAAQALSCSAGKYCPAGSSTIDQAGLCPAGYYCLAGADRANCTAGKYCAPGSSTPDQGGDCAAGYYCLSGQERVACVGSLCAAGEATANRVPCPQGYKCPGGGVVQEQCTAGTYADTGSSACTQCPRGLVAASAGAFRKKML